MCDSVIPDSIAAAYCLLVEPAAERVKTNWNRDRMHRLPTEPRHKTMVEEGLRAESRAPHREAFLQCILGCCKPHSAAASHKGIVCRFATPSRSTLHCYWPSVPSCRLASRPQCLSRRRTASGAKCAAIPPLPPQPAVHTDQNQPFTFKTSVTEVVLYATVVDSHQRLVTSLAETGLHRL